ncbi:MAG: hypothetical protein ACXQTN_05905 [Methanoculleaceae archaeon]
MAISTPESPSSSSIRRFMEVWVWPGKGAQLEDGHRLVQHHCPGDMRGHPL